MLINNAPLNEFDVVQLFQFDKTRHTYSVLILESSWKSLSNKATISLLLYQDMAAKLNVKNDGNVIHVFKCNKMPEIIPAQLHPDNKSMVCREFNDRYEVRMNIDKHFEKLSVSSKFVPLGDEDDDGTSRTKMAVEISVNSGKTIIQDFTMKFLCGLDTENFTLRLSVDGIEKYVEGCFKKKYEHTIGRLLLPW